MYPAQSQLRGTEAAPGAADCLQGRALPRSPRLWSVPELVTALSRRHRPVVTFLGYGELGYACEASFEAIARAELARVAKCDAIVNTGTLLTRGFRPGIAGVYPLAKDQGLSTMGIHPSIALAHADSHALAHGVDEIFFVHDPTWGGRSAHDQRLSHVLTALIALSDEAVAIGGGKHTAMELEAFVQAGKPVRFHPAAMHLPTALAWYARKGEQAADAHGEAHRWWQALYQPHAFVPGGAAPGGPPGCAPHDA